MRVLIWAVALVFVAGCFGRPDIGRIRIDPETGSELVENFKVPKPGDTNFVGPVDPNTDPTFKEGKAAAKQDFNRTVSWATSIALWIFIPLAIIVALASFVVPWIPTKAAIYCAASACAVVGIRYALLTFGTIAVDWAVYIAAGTAVLAAAFVGLPLVIAWVKRNTWKRGVEMIEGGHAEGATAALASVDPKVDKERKSVKQWIETYQGGLKEASQRGLPMWTEARMQLVKLGVLKPGDK